MKKWLVGKVAVVVMAAGAIAAQGLGVQHISMGTSGVTVYIEGYNEVGAKGSGSYGTDKNKVVTGCEVRLREGDYDETANNHKNNGGWTPKLSKINNPFKTAYTTYKWRY